MVRALDLLIIDQLCDRWVIATDCTLMICLRQFHCMEFHLQSIKCKKFSSKKISYTDQILDCFHCL